jgi:hypothetical protein
MQEEQMTSRALDRTQTLCTPQPKILEPGPRSQEVSNLDSYWTTTLPEDLLKELSIRLQLFYAVGVILWVINFVMDIYLAPHGDRGPYRLRRAARGRRAGGWGDAAARGEKRGFGIPIRWVMQSAEGDKHEHKHELGQDLTPR